MPEPTQPPEWPRPRGPWREVTDHTRLYDTGAYWCADSASHPDHQHGYPHPHLHFPYDECRTPVTAFTDVRADLTGPPRELEVYAAVPFQFGEPRSAGSSSPPRIVLDCYPDTEDAEPTSARFSLPLGEALRLSRRIGQLIDHVTTPPRYPLNTGDHLT